MPHKGSIPELHLPHLALVAVGTAGTNEEVSRSGTEVQHRIEW